jgi:hypothetical protein
MTQVHRRDGNGQCSPSRWMAPLPSLEPRPVRAHPDAVQRPSALRTTGTNDTTTNVGVLPYNAPHNARHDVTPGLRPG